MVAGKHELVGGASTTFDTRTGATSALVSTTFTGLPVVGFAAITFENETLPGNTGPVQSNYGGNLNHKVTTRIQ